MKLDIIFWSLFVQSIFYSEIFFANLCKYSLLKYLLIYTECPPQKKKKKTTRIFKKPYFNKDIKWKQIKDESFIYRYLFFVKIVLKSFNKSFNLKKCKNKKYMSENLWCESSV